MSLPHMIPKAGFSEEGVAPEDLILSSPSICTLDICKESSLSPHITPFIHRHRLTGSKQNFYREETPEATPAPAWLLRGSPSLSDDLEDHVKKRKKRRSLLLGRSKSARKFRGDFVKLYDLEAESTATSSPSQLGDRAGDKEGTKKNKKKSKKKDKIFVQSGVKDLEGELVLAKVQCAEYANQLEEKAWECKKAEEREALLEREVKEFKVHLSLLQAKARQCCTYVHEEPLHTNIYSMYMCNYTYSIRPQEQAALTLGYGRHCKDMYKSILDDPQF